MLCCASIDLFKLAGKDMGMHGEAASMSSKRRQLGGEDSNQLFPNLCETLCVRQYAFCAALDGEGLEALLEITAHRPLKAGQSLFQEGNPVHVFYNVLKGTLRQIKLLPDGRRQVIGFLHPGDFLGLAHDETYAHTVEAVTDAWLCAFSSEKLWALMHRYPPLEHQFLSMASRELRNEGERALLLGRKTSRERLASFLLELDHLQERYGRQSGSVLLPMTRADIADYLGLTLETVSRALSGLVKAGIIDLISAHEVRMKDVPALEGIGSGDHSLRS